MAADQFFMPFRPAYDVNGLTIPGAQIYFTVTGTNTKAPVYSDIALSVPLENPVEADAIGKLPPIYMDSGVSYRVRIYTPLATPGVSVPVEEYDPYVPGAQQDVAGLEAALATSGGAGMIGYKAAGAGAVAQTVQGRIRQLSQTPQDYGAVAGGGNASAAFTALIAAGNSYMMPPGAYSLSTSITIGGGMDWDLAHGATFSGAGNINVTDSLGFTHVPDFKTISLARIRGTLASPTTSTQPVALIQKNSLTPDIGGEVNSAFSAIHNHYGTAGESKAHAAFLETIVRTGGTDIISEGVRSHSIVPDGLLGKSFGGIFYAFNGGNALNCIGVEGMIIRGNGTDGPIARSYTTASQLDGCFAATVHTRTLAVGGSGGAPVAAFYVNPYNSQAAQTGFWVARGALPGGQTVVKTNGQPEKRPSATA